MILKTLVHYIAEICQSPLTAQKYTKELITEINKLKYSAESHRISDKASILQFGFNARRINYKKVSVLYTTRGNKVIIHRIIAGSLVTDETIL